MQFSTMTQIIVENNKRRGNFGILTHCKLMQQSTPLIAITKVYCNIIKKYSDRNLNSV